MPKTPDFPAASIPLSDIYAAQNRISKDIVRTPLVPLNADDLPSKIFLKLENLQQGGSFKIRAASNALKQVKKEQLKNGVWTVSSGNFAQALAWYARKFGVKCTILVPKGVSQAKLDAIHRLGAQTILPSISEGLQALSSKSYKDMKGSFVHPFYDSAVMAGNGTIGLELIEDLPELESVVIPWGGGGLAAGIASALRALKPQVKIFSAEIETCSPLADTVKRGSIPPSFSYTPSFVDGIGYPFLLPEMWEAAQTLLDGTFVVTVDETVQAVRLLAERNSIIAEGAGAVSVAAALSGKAGSGTIACIVSGGNIDSSKLVQILQGKPL
ncbi:MAG: threonine ammonia-lyase [Candidatus Hermodarchaeia archaeon]|jgi:threonine dehydratase